MRLILSDIVRRNWWQGPLCCLEYAPWLILFKWDPSSCLRTVVICMACLCLFHSMDFITNIRAFRTLPLSDRELGRAYWWASLGFPAIAMCATTLFVQLLTWKYSGIRIPLIAMCEGIIPGIALWAAAFHCSLLISAYLSTTGVWTSSKANLALLPKLTFLPLLFELDQLFPIQSSLRALFVTLCIIMSIVGWNRTEIVIRALANPVSLYRPKVGDISNSSFVPGGAGALRFLVGTSAKNAAITWCVALGGILFLLKTVQNSHHLSQSGYMETLYLWIVALSPALIASEVGVHLRVLRTMPISAFRLATTLVLWASLVSLISSGLIFLMENASLWQISRTMIPCCVIVSSFYILINIWRPPAVLHGLTFCGLYLVGSAMILIIDNYLSFAATEVITLLIVGASVAAVKWALDHGTRPYSEANNEMAVHLRP